MPFGSIWGYTTYFQTHPNGDMVGTFPMPYAAKTELLNDQTIGDSIQKKELADPQLTYFWISTGRGYAKKGDLTP